MKHKPGDIVYFKSQHVARYGKQGGTYEYYFKPGVKYKIEFLYGGNTGTICNLEDSTSHFAHSDIWLKIISVAEWREQRIKQLLK
jgi:hypothetical protein